MSYQPTSGQLADPWIKSARLEPFISNCYRPALDQVGRAYAARRPAIVLVSRGMIGPKLVIDGFVERLDKDVTAVRITDDCTDAVSCMQQIVRGIGFDPLKMDLDTLEEVLEMFLVFQRSKKLRTVLCFENPNASDWWIFDKIRRLVELETQEKFGLTVIQSEFPQSDESREDPRLNEFDEHLVERIILSPFTLAETRKFVRQKLQQQDSEHFQVEDVTKIFEFYAVKLIHDYSSGVPEYVERLCNRCLRLMRDTGETEVTAETVRTAADLLGLNEVSEDQRLNGLTIECGDDITTELQPGKLVVQVPGETVAYIPLTQDCLLIGRDRLCAVCIPGLKVSRYHALIVKSPQGLQFLDLESTNGSRVNCEPQSRCTLRDGDVIAIDQVLIRYDAGSEAVTWTAASAEADLDSEEDTATPINAVNGEWQTDARQPSD